MGLVQQELNVVVGGSAGSDEIGTFTNRESDQSVGDHPVSQTTTDTVYRFNQPSASVSESGMNRPLRWTGTAVERALTPRSIQKFLTTASNNGRRRCKYGWSI